MALRPNLFVTVYTNTLYLLDDHNVNIRARQPCTFLIRFAMHLCSDWFWISNKKASNFCLTKYRVASQTYVLQHIYNRRPICEPLYCYNNMYLLVLVTHALSARKFLVPRAIKNILYFHLGLSRISWGMRTYWSRRKQFVLILSQASHHHCLSFIKYIYLFMRIYLRN